MAIWREKVLKEEISGDVYSRGEKAWNYLYRLIDRANNWYEERVLSRKTGKIIHQKAEPLSQHRSKLPKPPGQI
jgi:hypothetical protein